MTQQEQVPLLRNAIHKNACDDGMHDKWIENEKIALVRSKMQDRHDQHVNAI